jgi:plastocyanin
MNHTRSIFCGGMLGLLITQLAGPVYAQDDKGEGGPPPTRAEYLRLQAEVREQRQLIIELMQTEQQRYDMILRLMQGQPGMPVPPSALKPAPSDGATADAASKGGKLAPAAPKARNGTVAGKVKFPGGSISDLYVYVDNVKAPFVRNKSVEIRQEDKQFVPRMAVVQTGTSVVFPNFDNVFHNVFSNSPRNTFDLGSYRAGDKPKVVTLTAPGVVEVFCNFHQKMSASILVVPNPLFAKVRPDGTFRIDNVPVGSRRLVAWSPGSKPAQQTVDVGDGVSQTSFQLAPEGSRAHLNKLGQAYGSYRD